GYPYGRVARSDDARDPVLAGHDRRVREQAAVVGDDRAEEREQDVERLGRGRSHQDVTLDDAIELRGSGDQPGRSLVDAWARGEPAEPVGLVLGLRAAEQRVQGKPGRAHETRDRGWQPGRVGRWLRR